MMVKMFILLYSRSMMMARGVLARLMYPPLLIDSDVPSYVTPFDGG